jgi:hypothetical protein
MANFTGSHKTGLSQQVGLLKLATAYYDFAVDGGAIGNITLRGDSVPSGAIVTESFVNVVTGVTTTGGTGTLALKVEGTGDLRVAGTAAAGTPAVDTAGPRRLLVNGTSTPVKTTADRPITLAVATNAITAGKFSVTLAYYEVA